MSVTSVAASTVRHLTMKKVYIRQIREGQKTVEGRIFKGAVCKCEVDDTLRFYYYSNAKDDVRRKIVDRQCFKTFRKMLETVGFKKCLPDAQSLDEAVAGYYKIPGYREKEAQYGVVAFYLGT